MSDYLGAPRFAVTEVEGFTKQGDGHALAGHVLPGLTCTVVDRAYCCQIMGVFRSEDWPRGGRYTRERRASMTRESATGLASRLNAKYA